MCNNCKNINETLQTSLAKEQEFASKGLLKRIACNIDGSFRIDQYDFLNRDPLQPSTVHPALWEQARLNMNYGLYLVNRADEVTQELADNTPYDDIRTGDVFQIRGFDLANMTLVYDGSGWIVLDVLTTTETASAAWENVVKVYLKDAPLNTVVYSHSHVDHYGGIGGLPVTEATVILAPEGFTRYAVSENIYAGTAMSRRAAYQYGTSLTPGEEGQVDCGLGKIVAKGINTILAPTCEIGFADYDEGCNYHTANSVDVIMQLQFTPGTEAPAEMNVYLPDQQVLFIAENCAGTLHNALTPRGAQVRDLLAWAGFLDQTLVTFPEMTTLCSAHNWPRQGNDECVRFIEIQRDMYRYINNATLHLVNLGYTIDEVGRMVSGEDSNLTDDDGNVIPDPATSLAIPGVFADEWCCHGFYGTFNHNAKAVYQRYIGWYDGNPSHLNRHTPAGRANRYVKAFGAVTVNTAAQNASDNEDYAWAAELYDYLLYADPVLLKETDMDTVRKEYADTLRQLGYQSEAASWRNMYLTAAAEIEAKKVSARAQNSAVLQFSDHTVLAMSLEMILQYLGIMYDIRQASGIEDKLTLSVTVTTGDKKEYAIVWADRAILGYRIYGQLPDKPGKDIAIEGDKLSFFRAFVENDTDELAKLNIKYNGTDKKALQAFIAMRLTRFPLAFPIMTPKTK